MKKTKRDYDVGGGQVQPHLPNKYTDTALTKKV